jgi:hypothetical protein
MSRKTTSLYHPFFTEEERRDLEGIPHDDLTGEIFLQRYLLVMVMSKSPPGPLDFELLLEKTRACNLAIRSLVSLINMHMELQKGKPSEWDLFVQGAHLLSAEELGIVEDVFPAEAAKAIRSSNPYYRRHKEMEELWDETGEPILPAQKPDVEQDTILPHS